MEYLILGAGGVLLVLAVLAAGAVLGWKGSQAWQRHCGKRVAKEATEEERQALEAEQRAFSSLLNYNADRAYNMEGSESR